MTVNKEGELTLKDIKIGQIFVFHKDKPVTVKPFIKTTLMYVAAGMPKHGFRC